MQAPAEAVVECAVALLRARLLTTWEQVEQFMGGAHALDAAAVCALLERRSAFRAWRAPRSG